MICYTRLTVQNANKSCVFLDDLSCKVHIDFFPLGLIAFAILLCESIICIAAVTHGSRLKSLCHRCYPIGSLLVVRFVGTFPSSRRQVCATRDVDPRIAIRNFLPLNTLQYSEAVLIHVG